MKGGGPGGCEKGGDPPLGLGWARSVAGSWQSPVWGGGAETYLPVCVHRQEEGVGVLLREGKERGSTLGPAWPRGSRGSGGSAWSRLTCCVPGSRLMLTKATQGLPSSGQVKCLVDKPTSSYSDQLYLLIENVEMSILQVGRGRLREADSPGQKVVRTLEPNPCSGSLCPAAPQRSDRGGASPQRMAGKEGRERQDEHTHIRDGEAEAQQGRSLGLFQAAQRLCLGLRLLPPFQTCVLWALKAQRSPAFRLIDTVQWESLVPILPAGLQVP